MPKEYTFCTLNTWTHSTIKITDQQRLLLAISKSSIYSVFLVTSSSISHKHSLLPAWRQLNVCKLQIRCRSLKKKKGIFLQPVLARRMQWIEIWVQTWQHFNNTSEKNKFPLRCWLYLWMCNLKIEAIKKLRCVIQQNLGFNWFDGPIKQVQLVKNPFDTPDLSFISKSQASQRYFGEIQRSSLI